MIINGYTIEPGALLLQCYGNASLIEEQNLPTASSAPTADITAAEKSEPASTATRAAFHALNEVF